MFFCHFVTESRIKYDVLNNTVHIKFERKKQNINTAPNKSALNVKG